ncbi:acyl carrier protein phosphodiesterase [Deminuibacter soli]|uniref:DUF479 domain-containing protein n=1 Tax=Deminuibacter soli TaxID=2291815 RepID=A0A3E1NRP8_9BACT|nr:ACP phosphodiesterase [Deminuibacter soli]RFM30438.1 DUF479 domain-containing protein [Deminuibacter soli]
MNYLAHAYLSFRYPQLLVGNMISDFVKGKQKFDYPPIIQEGIMLHRSIDHFTDTHAVTTQAKKHFKAAAGLYAGAFMDIVYDHFLALDENQHSETEWIQLAGFTYRTLKASREWLPAKFAYMLPYMESQDWLYNYRFTWGIENSFKGLTHRAAYLSDYKPIYRAFEENYEDLQNAYQQFFPNVKSHALQHIEQLPATG